MMIFIHNNIITIIIGHRRDVELEHIKRLGKRVDDLILETPKPEEMALKEPPLTQEVTVTEEPQATEEIMVTEESTSLPSEAEPQLRLYYGDGILESCPCKANYPDSCSFSPKPCGTDPVMKVIDLHAFKSIDDNGNVSGILYCGEIHIKGVRESVTGINSPPGSMKTYTLSARLTNDDQVLEGLLSTEPNFSECDSNVNCNIYLSKCSFTLRLQP